MRIRVVNTKKKVYEAYKAGGNEAAYATYRAITGATVSKSWKVVKPLIKKWGG